MYDFHEKKVEMKKKLISILKFEKIPIDLARLICDYTVFIKIPNDTINSLITNYTIMKKYENVPNDIFANIINWNHFRLSNGMSLEKYG